jgi:tyrosine-protein kinase Etk/Wzc
MDSPKGFHLLDYIEFAVKRKKLLVLVFLTALVISYATVYFLIEEQFEASALIIPRQDESSSLANSVLRGIKNVPLNLGSSSPNNQMDLYKTIIYSRTMMENVIRKFNLVSVFRLDTSDVAYMEKAIKRLTSEVSTKETEESAFVISVRTNARRRSADMTNYIVHAMNGRIVDLQVSRSRDNRMFLEQRVQDLKNEIRAAEDSLRDYQERTGLLDVKSQLQGILTTHASLETEFAGKQLQLNIMRRLYANNSPQVRELQIQVEEYEKKLNELRLHGDPGGPLLALKSLPTTSVGFLRWYREVEIDNLVLEYVMPMYEQAKFDEKKEYPVLQVIDYAVPPATKKYPPRVLFALIGACSLTILVYVLLILRATARSAIDPRWFAIADEAKRWRWKSREPR